MCLPEYNTIVDCGENVRTPHRDPLRVWPKPGKEPREDIDRAILVAIHHESTVQAMIRPFPQGHVLQVTTATTHLGRVALI